MNKSDLTTVIGFAVLLVGVLVVSPVVGDPSDDGPLDGHGAGDADDEGRLGGVRQRQEMAALVGQQA